MRRTLFSPVVDRQAIESVRTVLPDWSLRLEETPDDWHTARFTSAGGELVFSSMEFTAPQDEFSRVLLGTSGYFWRRKDLSETTKKEVLRFIGTTRWLIGIVGTVEGPDLKEVLFHEATSELAHRLGGRLFTGTELIVPERNAAP